MNEDNVIDGFGACLREHGHRSLQVHRRSGKENRNSGGIDAMVGTFSTEYASIDTLLN
jgi:hypothetical protein